MARPKTLTKLLPFRLTPSYWQGCQIAAKEIGTSPSAVIRLALRDYFRRTNIAVSEDV